MKLTKLYKLSAFSVFALCASCGDKEEHSDHDGHDHSSHAGHDHSETMTDKDGADDNHEKCGVVVGPNGGRMIEDIAELDLSDDGKLSLNFANDVQDDTKVAILLDSEPLELTQSGNKYESVSVTDKLPASVIVSIKGGEVRHVEEIDVEAGICPKCNEKKIACTCHNHDHGDHEGHDHSDHEGHDH